VTAEVLHKYVKDSDVVVITGHGVEVLYYLRRLGYKDGHCGNRSAGRLLKCRLFPLSWEGRFFRPGNPGKEGYSSNEYSIQQQAREYIDTLADQKGRVWMVLKWRIRRLTADGRLRISWTAEEAALAAELGFLGFKQGYIEAAPWIVVFHRPQSSGPGTLS
jgi:hypothetical protein